MDGQIDAGNADQWTDEADGAARPWTASVHPKSPLAAQHILWKKATANAAVSVASPVLALRTVLLKRSSFLRGSSLSPKNAGLFFYSLQEHHSRHGP
jgi:hypothetical protein